MGLPPCWCVAYDFTKNKPTMDALVGDQESTVNDRAANPCLSVAGTETTSTHRAREREMLYRLGVTGCSSRVALSEMLRGLADSFTATELQICRTFFGRAGIGQTSQYAVMAAEIFAIQLFVCIVIRKTLMACRPFKSDTCCS